MTTTLHDPGDLSRLLLDLARVPKLPVPAEHFEPLAPGTMVGRFVVQRELGRGGFGVVYQALDPELGRQVALKLLRPGISLSRGEGDWIQREAEAVARLAHPAIVTLFDFGRSDRGAFLVFELLQGEPLDARITRGGLTTGEILRVAVSVAAALEHAHAAGVLHRDLKPGNVFLCGPDVVKVLDFGIAQLFDREAGPRSGTPGYMAPEQLEGGPEDARTDLFALGVLLDAVLKAAPPPSRGSRTARQFLALQILADELQQPDPARRPQSTTAVVAELAAIQRDARGAARRRAVVAALALLISGMVWWALEATRTREAPAGDRLAAVVAPTRNDSGAPELDHLTEMLRTGLSDSPRFRFVPHEEVDEDLRRKGLAPASADPTAWREAAARQGATAVVFPEARKDSTDFVVTLSGRDASTGDVRFRAEARAPTLQALPFALDEALLRLRRGAGERAEDLAANPRTVSQLTSPSLAAYHEYALGLACIDDLVAASGEDSQRRCSPRFVRALELDPGFALASYVLGHLMSTEEGSQEGRPHLDRALSGASRLSRRDEAIVRARKSRLDRDDAAALAGYSALASEFPGDLRAVYEAAELLFHSMRPAEAIPYLVRLVRVGSAYPHALGHLVEAYGATGREAELAKLLDEIGEPSPDHVADVVTGNLFLRRFDSAIEIARRNAGGKTQWASARTLHRALSAAGCWEEADDLAKAMLASAPSSDMARYLLVWMAIKRGEPSKAATLLNALPAKPDERAYHTAEIALARGDLGRVRAEMEKLWKRAAPYAALPATELALYGTPNDVATAGEVASPGSLAAKEIEALAVWKRGEAPRAIAMLAALDATYPRPNMALPPSFLLAVVALESDPEEALAAAERYRRRLPQGLAALGGHGRSLVISAEAAHKLGRREKAIGYVAELERLLANAEPGIPVVQQTARVKAAILRTSKLGAAGVPSPAHATAQNPCTQ